MLSQREVLEVLGRSRRDSIVITTMGSVGIWPEISDSPLDFHYLPSSMGQGISLALGLSLSVAQRNVVVLSGDGSLLMNPGSLGTVAQYPTSLRILLIDNGLYEVTGGQAICGSRKIDFAQLATSFGIPDIYTCDSPPKWETVASGLFDRPGPTFIWLKVSSEYGKKTPVAPRSMTQQIDRLQQAIFGSTEGIPV